MYTLRGMKASEAVARLQALIKEHGDLLLVGNDSEYGYPEGVSNIHYQPKDETKHYDKPCFVV
jgi:hypothetical protein